MKVGVSLGFTVCTNLERRDFTRIGFDITDIDTNGDVEVQARDGMAAVLKVMAIGNEDIKEALTSAIEFNVEDSGSPFKGDVDYALNRVKFIEEKLIPNIVEHVQKLGSVV